MLVEVANSIDSNEVLGHVLDMREVQANFERALNQNGLDQNLTRSPIQLVVSWIGLWTCRSACFNITEDDQSTEHTFQYAKAMTKAILGIRRLDPSGKRTVLRSPKRKGFSVLPTEVIYA